MICLFWGKGNAVSSVLSSSSGTSWSRCLDVGSWILEARRMLSGRGVLPHWTTAAGRYDLPVHGTQDTASLC